MLEFFPFPVLIGVILLILLLVILWSRKNSRSYLFFFSIFWIYLLALIGLTLFPIPCNASKVSASLILSRVNLMPFNYSQFSRLDPAFVFIREIVDNILLTVPFGFGICFIARVRAKIMLWLAFAVGIGIETSQLILCLILGIAYRGVDLNDAIMNALGVLLGYGLIRLFSRLDVAISSRFKIQQKGIFAYIHTISVRVLSDEA
jgi:glycopeptide antibiotics resistance protein